HPVSVHTPNGILPAIIVLWFAAWVSGSDLLAKAAFINLIFVLIALPFVIFTGVLEWQKKYKRALTNTFKIKITAAIVTTILTIISFVWYLINPDVLSSSNAWLFILINIITVTAVGIAGHIGGKLVFKD
ncbi:MAG: rubredoxin, partial [Desulfobacteraceae bacterium]|nr:rubredoxin [Desulfobacteraceae bacterium]